jgi:hypothetical protein
MTLAAALAATTTLLATGFALSTAERWVTRRKPQEAAWTAALALFAVASGAQWLGAAIGWDAWTFRTFYLLGPSLSVPYLALGTVWLLASPAVSRRVTLGVHVFSAFATGIVIASPARGGFAGDALPRGSEVFDAGPRIVAAVGSAVPTVVIVGGAVWSAWRLRHTGDARLVVTNVLVSIGTVVLAAAGLFNSVLDEMSAFALGHAIGLAIVFAGFLVSNPRRRADLRLATADDARAAAG